MKNSIYALLFLTISLLTDLAQMPNGSPQTFDKRLGEDDGAALAIMIGGNFRGSLEVCD